MRALIATSLLALILTGCQTLSESGILPDGDDQAAGSSANQVKRTVAFSPEEYAQLEKSGTATLKGQLFYQNEGLKVIGRDQRVSLAPATRYSAEAADAALAGKRIEPADPRARAYTHTATTDSEGHFTFTGLPSGVFYVGGVVRLPDGSMSPYILKQVRLGVGQTKTVKLTR
ncbi:carboxypeptidase-like regulatory domain-containing protein [Larsenimonas salina]|uniref:carboxypeptidase-like regulatory domain-containing protein n=1 Tax=Larsenimonas salina TaxID=1295565 RepID=UPI002073BAAF|nr:carboxypeptidase-like regulatory domain-containing protein [Larsenimonas salina]MCM5704590.1 carboxypeptidase-like regulatory domain-containing protein [Larsenimonas salina]